MATIEGANSLRSKLAALKRKAASSLQPETTVGYTANYALYVHENVEMKWKGKPRKKGSGSGKGNYWDPAGRGQSKFLEQPYRELNNNGTLSKIVSQATSAGVPLATALHLAGLRLLRESQRLVPVDTGNLKNSGFIRDKYKA